MDPQNVTEPSTNVPTNSVPTLPASPYEPPPPTTEPTYPMADIPHQFPIQTPTPKKSRRLLWIVLLLVIMAAGASAYFFVFKNKETAKPQTSTVAPTKTTTSAVPYLLYSDYTSGTVVLTDKTGKTIYKAQFPKGSYATYEAASPDRQVFMSVYNPTAQESSYLLLAKDGTSEQVSPTAATILGTKTNLAQSEVFSGKDSIVLTVCSNSSSTSNDCKIAILNLVTGAQQILLDTTVPVAFATGESVFNIAGISSDQKTIYIEVQGSTKLGDSNNALYSFDLASSQATKLYEFAKGRAVDNLTMSPDNKKFIYDTQVGDGGTDESAVIYTVDIASGKEVSINWSNTIPGGGYPFVWSPSGSKVTVQGNKQLTGPGSSIGPLTLAYINVADNTLVELQTIQDSAHKNVERQYWLDESTTVYGLDTSNTDHDFTNSTEETLNQNITSKKITNSNIQAAYLQHVIFNTQ